MSTQPERDISSIPDDHLLKRAVQNARPPTVTVGQYRWVVVGKVFGLGSTFSQQLCRRFGLDPDDVVNKNGVMEDKRK